MIADHVKPTTIDLGRTIKWLLSGHAKKDITQIHETNMEKLNKVDKETKEIHRIVVVENHITMKLVRARGAAK